MQPDLILRGANLPDGRRGYDILIKDGMIQAVGQAIDARGREELDVSGRLVTPPFVDCHFHMDATLSLGLPRLNRSGTLLEGIELWNELKPLLTHEAVVERALAYCDMAVAQGIGAIRSHVDVCDDRLFGVEALLEVKRQVAPYLTLQLVAFPQDGLYRSPNARENLVQGARHRRRHRRRHPAFRAHHGGRAPVGRGAMQLAADRGLMVDLHCDETDDPLSRHIETLAAETPAPWPHGPGRGLAPDLHAQHGQLLRQQAHPPDRRGRRRRDRQPLDQHLHPGPARHLPEAPRPHPRRPS